MRIAIVLLCVVACAAACKRRRVGPLSGQCEALRYIDGEPDQERCVWRGYIWECSRGICDRAEPVKAEQ